MNRKQISSLVVFIILGSTRLVAQDPEFSQFYANSVYTNPALAGSDCRRIILDYRLQYYGLPGGYVTFNASYDHRLKKNYGGIGLMYTHDIAGEGLLKANHLNAVYANEWAISKKISIRIGVQGGFFQKSLLWDKLRWGDQIISILGFTDSVYNYTSVDKSILKPNFALGTVIFSNKFYAGFAIHNILEPNQSFFEGNSKLPRRYTLHGGVIIPLDGLEDTKFSISPNILVMSQAKFNQVNIGFYISKSSFVTGLWFRQTVPNADALIGMLGYREGHFKIAYTLDITISGLRKAGKTGHEISLIYQFTKKKNPCSPNPRCPVF